MKILQLTNKVPYPPRDGGAIASLTLARELVRAGHKVVVLAMNTSKHFTDPQSKAGKPPEKIQWEFVPVNTDIKWPKALVNMLFSRLPYNAVRFRSREYRLRLLALLAENHFDFIILDQVYTGLYIKDIRQRTKTPIVLRAHNIEHEIWSRTARSSSGLKRLYLSILTDRIRRFELSLINKYDALVPITSRDAGHFMNLGNKKPCHVLPTGMDIPDNKDIKTDNPVPSVAHLGALDWLPNRDGIHWFVSQVWPIVRQAMPDLEFHLAGRNAPTGFAQDISAPGIVYHGEIEHARDFIRSHAIFIVPLFSGSGMRIKMLDYMAAGRAVVTTTIGAEGISVADGREAFITDQPEQFAAHIISLARDPALRGEMGTNAVAFVRKNFDNKALVRQFTEFLKTIDSSR